MKLIVFLLFNVFALNLCARDKPFAKDVLTNLMLANDYFMNKWPDPGKSIVTNKERPSNIWTRATYYEGLMGLYRIRPEQKFLD